MNRAKRPARNGGLNFKPVFTTEEIAQVDQKYRALESARLMERRIVLFTLSGTKEKVRELLCQENGKTAADAVESMRRREQHLKDELELVTAALARMVICAREETARGGAS